MRGKAFSVFELLVVLMVVGVIGYFLAKNYSGPVVMDQATAQRLSQEGINSDSSQTIVSSAQALVGKLEQKQAEPFELYQDGK